MLNNCFLLLNSNVDVTEMSSGPRLHSGKTPQPMMVLANICLTLNQLIGKANVMSRRFQFANQKKAPERRLNKIGVVRCFSIFLACGSFLNQTETVANQCYIFPIVAIFSILVEIKIVNRGSYDL